MPGEQKIDAALAPCGTPPHGHLNAQDWTAKG